MIDHIHQICSNSSAHSFSIWSRSLPSTPRVPGHHRKTLNASASEGVCSRWCPVIRGAQTTRNERLFGYVVPVLPHEKNRNRKAHGIQVAVRESMTPKEWVCRESGFTIRATGWVLDLSQCAYVPVDKQPLNCSYKAVVRELAVRSRHERHSRLSAKERIQVQPRIRLPGKAAWSKPIH